ncbi:MAG TPA: hypothetical protein ENI98_13425 [Gammaproteobacteria bacterium]|nr:hypothetical protein [Gammaproteobacteria bacterium]
MKPNIIVSAVGVVLCLTSPGVAVPTHAADAGDIQKLKKELRQIKAGYQTRIEQLEQRLDDAETANDETNDKMDDLAVEVSQQGNQKAANTFNPGIGVVLTGKYLHQDPSAYQFAPPGFVLGGEPGPGAPGFELGESELNLSANVDDYFYGSVTLSFSKTASVEEAYLQTIALPYGFSAKLGRFFSSIGYLSSRHTHTDDFAMRPLAYQVFLGGQYGDDGVELSWLAPTDLYWESGMEFYRGDTFPAAGAANHGQGVTTVFTHIGGDINDSQSWRAGISWLGAKVENRAGNHYGESFSGASDLLIADFIWKWAPLGNPLIHNAKFQGEYFQRNERGHFRDSSGQVNALDSGQNGWYLQGIYQFMPKWRVGLRYEELDAGNPGSVFAGSTLDPVNVAPKQASLMFDWSNSEFSRMRFQYSRDESSSLAANLWILQYIAAFGAHGAHTF